MKTGFFLDAITGQEEKVEQQFNKIGNNTGNMVFHRSLVSALEMDLIPVHDANFDVTQYDSFITTDLIWIRNNFDMSYLKMVLDKIGDRPLIPISVGLQANTKDMDFIMHPNTIKLLKEISERCIMGVRGFYTAEILNKYGIQNFRVIGCPSMYYQLDKSLSIQPSNNKITQVVSNYETFYNRINQKKKHFLSYCATAKYPFIEQTNSILTHEMVQDDKLFSYLNEWLESNTKIFFNPDEWSCYMRKFDFSIGARFHGNVMALLNGVPALFMTVDSRTTELCEYFKFPTMHIDDFDITKPIEYYYEKADYSNFNSVYPALIDNFIDFCKLNGLCMLAQGNTKIKDDIPVDRATLSITESDTEIVQAYKKAIQKNSNIFLILCGTSSLNRSSYRPALQRLGISKLAYFDPDMDQKELDGLKVFNVSELTSLETTAFLLLDKENASITAAARAINNVNFRFFSQIVVPISIIQSNEIRVIDEYRWNKSWPWYFDLIYPMINQEDKESFSDEFPFCTWRVVTNNYYSVHNKIAKHYTISNNIRHTCYVPTHAKNKIYFLGDFRIYGTGCPDQYTIQSLLQKEINEKYSNVLYEVINLGVPGANPLQIRKRIQSLSLQEGDIVLASCGNGVQVELGVSSCYSEDALALAFAQDLDKCNRICLKSQCDFYFFAIGDIGDVCNQSTVERFIASAFAYPKRTGEERRNFFKLSEKYCFSLGIKYRSLISCLQHDIHKEIFWDCYHYGPLGNEILAHAIFESIFIAKVVSNESKEQAKELCQKSSDKFDENIFYSNKELNDFTIELEKISANKSEDAGIIVMNCNPFTFGHRYLIETAAAQVTQLYILVVEEDKSDFKFKDRYEMVKLGVDDLENVMVLPSGKYVISNITFPDYFNKEEIQKDEIDPSRDILIFCKKIAPALKAKKRFAGEEPFCKITNQYNQKMNELLTKYNMEFISIERMHVDGGKAISATTARKLLREQDFNNLSKLVPQCTIDYLRKHSLYL